MADMPPPAATRTLSAAVLRNLRDDIVNCRLKPGDKLRFSDLKARYGVGLSPLREALHHLAAEGLVDAQDQRGFTVAPMSLDDLMDLVRLRVEIETLALRGSIAQGGDAWEAEVVRSAHMLRLTGAKAAQLDDDARALWRHRHKDFHMALLGGGGSPRMEGLCASLFDQSERYRLWLLLNGNVARDVEGEHAALMDAALERHADRAVALLRQHIERTAGEVAQLTARLERSPQAA